jgi:phosphomannomutase
MTEWLERYRSVLEPHLLAGLKIGIDEHSSVAAGSLGEILAGFGADIMPFGRLDHFEPLDTEAVNAERLRDYAQRAAHDSLFAIVTTDPDGDRPLLADETGMPLRGDLLGWITAHWLGADAVAVPVNGNSRIVSGQGLSVTRTRIGSPYVLEAIDTATRGGARTAVGFEPNGGFMTGTDVKLGASTLSPLPTRDAVLPILGALQFAVSRKLPLSALARREGFRSAASDRIRDFPVERSHRLMAGLAKDAKRIEAFVAPLGGVRATDWTDGLRITLDTGSIVHLRPSGNAPEMRCYVEADTDGAAEQLLAWGLARIAEIADETG